MAWLQPTRLVSLLALASAGGLSAACKHADPRAAPPAASTMQPSGAAIAAAPPPVASETETEVETETETKTEAQTVAAPETAKRKLRLPTKVLVIGDSLSDEARGGGGFVRFLRERCPSVVVDNRAKGGSMVNQMRKRLETEILPEGGSYSHAIVFGGVNDLYSDQTANRSLTRIEADLTRIYAALQQRNIEVIAVTVTPWGGFSRWFTPARSQNTQTLNAWILDQPRQGTISAALDAYPLLSCGVPTHLCPALSAPFKDGLHFGKLGHQKLGEALYDLAFQSCARP